MKVQRFLAIVTLLAIACLMLGAWQQQGILAPIVAGNSTSGGGSVITLIDAQCRDHQGTAGPVTCTFGNGDTTTKAITLGHTTATNDSIIVFTFGTPDGASSGTLTDSGSQSYTKGTNVYTGLQGGHGDATLWYLCNSASGVTTVTWTPEASDVTSGSAMAILHYSGLASACHDAATVWSGSPQTSPFTGTSATTAHASDLLLIPVFADGSAANCSDKTVVGTGSWAAQVYTTENGSGGVVGLLSQIVSSTGSFTGTGTSNATGTCLYAGIETFKGTP